MDPVTLATLTAGVTVLGTEVAKGAASQAGKDLWARVKAALGWNSEPSPGTLASSVAAQLHDHADVALQVLEMMKSAPASTTYGGTLVQQIDAQKVVVATHIDTVHMD